MEEKKNIDVSNSTDDEVDLLSVVRQAYTIFLLNWKWFVFSLVVCLGLAFVYLRYATPTYKATAKVLIKDDDAKSRSSSLQNMLANVSELGMISNSTGIYNEMEMLQSTTAAAEAIRNLKLYVMYKMKGRVKYRIQYKTNPITVSMDTADLNRIQAPIEMTVVRLGDSYSVKGECYPIIPEDEEVETTEKSEFRQALKTLPATVKTINGDIVISNNGTKEMKDGDKMKVVIYPPSALAMKYAKDLDVSQSSNSATIAILSMRDSSPQRLLDYLKALVDAYNNQANEEKNMIARRTEDFINDRIQKISVELGNTEGTIEQYKRSNNVVELNLNATNTVQNVSQYDQKLAEINMQISLINSLGTYIDDERNLYQVIPSNIGLTDVSTTSLITNYNKVALERNSLMRTAGAINPTLKPLTAQLDELHSSIKEAMSQAKSTLEIQKRSIQSQYSKYRDRLSASPSQQRVLNEIGRQQEVQTALYTMLLQKREENSISIASVANKGQLIDKPVLDGKVSPKNLLILLLGIFLGVAIPYAVVLIRNLLKYKIGNSDDILSRTDIPLIAEVPVANEKTMTRGEIVVHENKNNMMEEVFRSLRTNLKFLMSEGEKVLLVTSSISGEGKTFVSSNLATSLALLGKRIVVVGLDVRKPRLAELFQIEDRHHGITPLLAMENPTPKDVKAQIVNSGVNANLDLLMAGPVPPNPAELVDRKQLETVIDALRDMYDFVLLDTAPVGLVTDTLRIGRVADFCVIVFRADYTPKDNVLMIDAMNSQSKLPKSAIVLNGIDMSKKEHSYYYGFGKYGHYARYGSYGSYGTYGTYGSYGNYSRSHYSDNKDDSVKL